MNITSHTKDRTLIVKVSGELDHHSAAQIREKTDFRIMGGNIKNMILDFSDLNFMDSSGIGVIIGRYKLITSIGGKLVVISKSKEVSRILDMSGIKKIISVTQNMEDAVKAL